MQRIAPREEWSIYTIELGVISGPVLKEGLPARGIRVFRAYSTTYFLKERLPTGETQPSETTSHQIIIRRLGSMVTGTPHSGEWLVRLLMALICGIVTSSLTSPWPLLVVNDIHAAGLPLSCSCWCIGRMTCVLHTLHRLCVVLLPLCSVWSFLQTRMEDRLPAYDVRLEGRSLLAELCVDFPPAEPLLHPSSRVIEMVQS